MSADIVISEFIDEGAISSLSAEFDVVYDPVLVDQPDRLKELVSSARALLVRNRTQVRGDLLAGATRLACVGRLGVGLDNIDVGECGARGISVYPATGANDLSVAEYVITAALVLLRGSWLSTEAMIDGKWPRQQLVGRELAGRTIGIVGYGAIGRQVATRASDLGMSVVGYDPMLGDGDAVWGTTKPMSFEEVLASSDVVTLHVPLNEKTHHLIGKAALDRMRPGAVVINAARGGVVDEGALVAAMEAGRVSGAALDVFENEPLTAEDGSKFAGIANLLLTPHIAGVTDESNVRVSSLIAQKVAQHLRALP